MPGSPEAVVGGEGSKRPGVAADQSEMSISPYEYLAERRGPLYPRPAHHDFASVTLAGSRCSMTRVCSLCLRCGMFGVGVAQAGTAHTTDSTAFAG